MSALGGSPGAHLRQMGPVRRPARPAGSSAPGEHRNCCETKQSRRQRAGQGRGPRVLPPRQISRRARHTRLRVAEACWPEPHSPPPASCAGCERSSGLPSAPGPAAALAGAPSSLGCWRRYARRRDWWLDIISPVVAHRRTEKGLSHGRFFFARAHVRAREIARAAAGSASRATPCRERAARRLDATTKLGRARLPHFALPRPDARACVELSWRARSLREARQRGGLSQAERALP
jgi:hypothetical protein